MEIGSIYEINPKVIADDSVDKGVVRLTEVEKYNKKYIRYTQSGREAIAWALRSLEISEPGIRKECLMPAYMCDSVFFPFVHAGWKLHFYHIGKNFQASEEELRSLVEHIRPGLLFIHPYYGVDTWKPMRSLLKEWRGRGIHVMEDVTQSYYLEGAGLEADYVIGSLRKWYPIPDGGFVASDLPISMEELPAGGEFSMEKWKILTSKWEYLHGNGSEAERKARKEEYLKHNRVMEEWLDEWESVHEISEISKKLLRSEDEEHSKKCRNTNYRYLSEALQEFEYLITIFPTPEEGIAPLYFPIYVKEREKLQEFLRKKDIYAPVLWPVGKENKEHLSEAERYIYENLLVLPMDQRYGENEMKRMIEAIREYT